MCTAGGVLWTLLVCFISQNIILREVPSLHVLDTQVAPLVSSHSCAVVQVWDIEVYFFHSEHLEVFFVRLSLGSPAFPADLHRRLSGSQLASPSTLRRNFYFY